MPIDQYFDKLEGVRTSDKIRFTSKSANDKGYIFLEGKSHGSYSYRDLLISCEKSHFGLNWFNAHHALHRENSFMLNIRQYVDFLSLLKIGRGFDGNGQRIDESILLKMAYDILEIKDPWQGEWLDADFKVNPTDKSLIINYDHRTFNNKLQPAHFILLEDYLSDNKNPGIDLEQWIDTLTRHGLPPSNIKSGNLWYFAPINNSVAVFFANSGRAGLDCNRGATYRSPGLGVRRVKIKT
ncbi:hypothetical protein J4471_00505 [Candidatus Woesearchaeota archaeon]|nr:hypothetical protein [Candidatus Woesearchaeota archaeon]